MKKTLNFITIGAALFALASCDLDLTPKGEIVYDPDNLITNATDLAGFEADVIDQLRGLEYGVYDQGADIMVDYFNATIDYGNNYGPIHRMDDTFTASDYDSEDNWENFYYAIRHFNVVINAKNIPEDLADDAAIAIGEAHFGRAFAYLHMIRLFGKPYGASSTSDLGVPLVLEDDINALPSRATVAEVYAQIKADLDKAAELLSGISGEVRAKKPTIDAVNALYARYYLDTKDYANAAAKAASVIGTGKYQLASDSTSFAAEWRDDNGTEPILQYYASLDEGGAGSHGHVCSSESNDSDHGLYYQPYFLPCETIINAYEDTDLRLALWFSRGGSYGGNAVEINGLWYTDEFYVFNKYPGNMALTAGKYHTTAHAVKPLLISEMYLIASEAYAQSGDTGDAARYLNELQTARGASTTTGALANVKEEWYKETIGEGLRMSCLKRWGDGFSGRPAQAGATSVVMEGVSYASKELPANDFHWQWPVPTYELQVNDNLVQNEGYASNQ